MSLHKIQLAPEQNMELETKSVRVGEASESVGHMYQLIVAYWSIDARRQRINIGSNDGLLSGGIGPFPEPVLIYYQWGPVTSPQGQFRKR